MSPRSKYTNHVQRVNQTVLSARDSPDPVATAMSRLRDVLPYDDHSSMIYICHALPRDLISRQLDMPVEPMVRALVDDIVSGQVETSAGPVTISTESQASWVQSVLSGLHHNFDRVPLHIRLIFHVKQIFIDLLEKDGHSHEVPHLQAELQSKIARIRTIEESVTNLEAAIDSHSTDAAQKEVRFLKASHPIPDAHLDLRSCRLQARLLVSQESFYDAAVIFRRISNHMAADEPAQADALSHAVVYSLLTFSSVSNLTFLKSIKAEDSRASSLPVTDILDAVCSRQMLTTDQISRLLTYIPPAAMDNKLSQIPTRCGTEVAILGHNLKAISMIYETIPLSTLGNLLGTTAAETEEVVAMALTARSFLGSIDQATGTVRFLPGRYDRGPIDHEIVQRWDQRVLALNTAIEHTAASVERLLGGPAANVPPRQMAVRMVSTEGPVHIADFGVPAQ